MADYGVLLCTLAVLGSFISGAHSLTCYQCNSHNDSRCSYKADELPDALKQPCRSSKDKMCRKITQVVEFGVNGMPSDSRIIRSCGWDDSTYFNRCYQRSGFGGRQEVCSCDSENCNAAGIPVVMTTVVLGTVALLLHVW